MASTSNEAAEITKSTLSKDADTTKPNPPTLHRAVADLAIAYMEEMRDDVSESHRESASPSDDDNIETAPSAIVDLNIQEIISNVAKSHSLSSGSYAAESKASTVGSASRASKAASKASEASSQNAPFPSQAVPNPTNDEIISRFGSIVVSGTNDTESISELGTMIETRGLISNLKTELMSWTETGCCVSPSSIRAGKSCISRFDEIEMSFDEEGDVVINVDVVKTDSAENYEVEGAADDVEEEVVEEEEEDVSVQGESSVEEKEEAVESPSAESEDFQEVEEDECKLSASAGSERNIFKASISVETDLTEPTKNSEQPEAATSFAKVSASAEAAPESTSDSLLQDATSVKKTQDAAERSDTASVASKSVEFPKEAILTPASSGENGKNMARCASPSIDTETSVTSSEVAALLAAIKNESVDSVVEEELAAINNDSVDKNGSLEDEVRCTSPSIDTTERSVTSARVDAILEAIRNESPVSSFPEESGSVVSKTSVKSEGSVAARKVEETVEEKTDDVVTEAEEEEAVIVSKQSPREETGASKELEIAGGSVEKEPTSVNNSKTSSKEKNDVHEPVIKEVIDQAPTTESTNSSAKQALREETTRSCSSIASILKLAVGVPPTESVLSPHSEASCMTDIASNQTPTPLPANKTVHWSMSLDALSSDGDFVACASSKSCSTTSEITRESNVSPLATPTPKDTGIIESCNKKLKEEGWSRPFDELTAGWVAKIKKDWQYIETSSLAVMKEDFVSWTESGACFRDTTLTSPCPSPRGEARDADAGRVQDGGDSTVEKRDDTSVVKAEASGATGSPMKEDAVSVTAKRSSSPVLDMAVETIEATKQFFSRGHEEQRGSPTQPSVETKSLPVTQEIKAPAAPVFPTTRARTAAETEHLHEDVYKERDYLREWKLDAEETMKCQDAVTRVLREQKLSLVKQCNELERSIMDLKEWKFDASDEMQSQSTQLRDLLSQKAELMKQCEANQESIQELSNWKFAAEDAISIREAELKQVRMENSTLSAECREQREAIKDLTEWKIESMDTMKNQLAELESAQSKSLSLITQIKTYEDSINQLTSWKSENEPVMQNHVEELKRLKDENASLVTKCDDQQISLDKLNRWKMNAEEELKQQLAKLDAFEKQVAEFSAHSSEQKQSTSQLAKWKSDAEVTIKKQIKTIDELTQLKITATEQADELRSKIDSLQTENADLTKKCEEYKTTIEELTASKVAAHEAEKNQLAELEKELKVEREKGLNDKERTILEELTKWKAEAEMTIKDKETELNELQSHYLIFGKQCNEQKELIQRRDDEILSLTNEVNNATKKISRLDKDTSKQAKKIKSYEDTIQSKTEEVAELKAEIAKLTDRLENQDQPHKQELVAMKMAHHKELMVLKTERHMLASKIEKLANKNEDLSSQVTNLNVEMEELESKYQHEKEGHQQSKIAVKTLEKALKSSEKKRKQMEKKLASDADFCDILSQRLNEGL
ncbi:hypothetical protein ACHAXN_004183 [Cyclotella atomus]